MNNLALSRFPVQELNSKEMIEIDGGRISWSRLRKYGEQFLVLTGIYDIINDFSEGWNSVDCGCSKK